MKTIKTLFILKAIVILVLTSCETKITETYKVVEPTYLTYEDLRSSVKSTGVAEEIEQPGKIYFYQYYLFINEYQKGVHVIDNSDPSYPQFITFINIPGNVDISVMDDILYADSYIDLVVIDISDINNITEIYRIEDAFPYVLPPFDDEYSVAEIDEEKGIITGWIEKEVEVEVPSNRPPIQYRYYPEYFYGPEMIYYDAAASYTGGGEQNFGVGGSMARFTISSKVLYAVDEYYLRLFDLSEPTQPEDAGSHYIGWDIETIFPYKKNLYIGSSTGMYIYDIKDPLNPSFVSSYMHVSSCDPVVVEGRYAYVTLRSGTECQGFTDQLDVVDLANLSNPKLIKSYDMYNPHGLGVDDGTLFICDGDEGLKIYDASDPLHITDNMISHFEDINTFDIIPINGVAMMIGADGFYQYDYSDLENIVLLSTIELK